MCTLWNVQTGEYPLPLPVIAIGVPLAGPPLHPSYLRKLTSGGGRQVIEYRALSLLGSTPSVISAQATYNVAIPKVLKFFEADRVLVLQDLGKWMEPFESWICHSTTSGSNIARSPPSPETCRSVGTRLGNVLASVHCDTALLLESQTVTDDGKLWFENPDTKDLVRTEIVDKILPILRPHFDPDTGRPEKIAKIIRQDFENSFLDTLRSSSTPPLSSDVPKMMFSMGDLWTGSILVGVPPAKAPGYNPTLDGTEVEVELGLIDWEFAAPARIGQDITQLSAWLYLYSTSLAWSSAEPYDRRAVVDATAVPPTSSIGLDRSGPDFGIGVCDGFGAEGGTKHMTGEMLGQRSIAGSVLNALLEAYAHKIKEHPNYAWFVDEDHDDHKLRKDRLAIIRSIWVLFGREIIYNASEVEPKFSKFLLPVGVDGDEKEVGIKALERVMIEVGSWYVLKAGESSDEGFEEVVRKEGVLKRMYTVSEPL